AGRCSRLDSSSPSTNRGLCMTNVIGGESCDGQAPRCCAAERPDGVLASIAAVLASGASFLADIIDRIVNGIRSLAPLVISLGCQSTNEPAAVAPPVVEALPAPKLPPSKETGPRKLGQFTITFYYVVGEDEIAAKPVAVASGNAANDNRSEGNDEAEEPELTA